MPRNKMPIPDDLLELKQRLAEWRSCHPRRSRLPEEFWMAAVELARKHGVYRTARTLPIDYANLRQRLAGPAEPKSGPRPQFLELFTPQAQLGAYVEILRVPLSSPPDWNQLLRVWRRSE